MRVYKEGAFTGRDEHVVGVGGECVEDGVVAAQILYEFGLGQLPLFDVVGRGGRHRVVFRMECECAHALLVIGERANGLAGHYVPAADCRVMTRRYYLLGKHRA